MAQVERRVVGPADVEAAAELASGRGVRGWGRLRHGGGNPAGLADFPAAGQHRPARRSMRRGRRRRRVGTLVRYADDFVVLCPTRERAEEARDVGRGGSRSARAAVASRQDQDRAPRARGEEGFDFLGFHHRMRSPAKWRGRWYLNKWPSARAMASIRAKVRERTADRRCRSARLGSGGRRPQPRAAGLGRLLPVRATRSKKFAAIDSYVHQRLARLASSQARTPRPQLGEPVHLRLAPEPRRLPAHWNGALPDRACAAMNGVGEPCAGEPHARFDRGPLARTPHGETEHAPDRETGGTEPVRPTGHRQTSGLPHRDA